MPMMRLENPVSDNEMRVHDGVFYRVVAFPSRDSNATPRLNKWF